MPPPAPELDRAAKATGSGSRTDEQNRPHIIRRNAVYCAPHVKIPGILAMSPRAMRFTPDPENLFVKEFGKEEYQCFLEMRDVIDCISVSVQPERSPSGGDADEEKEKWFMQLFVRTLDGQAFISRDDAENAWCVVFRMRRREELYEASTIVIDATERYRQEALAPCQTPVAPARSRTSIPFPCLDVGAEVEATDQKQLRRQVSEGTQRPCDPPCETSEIVLRPGHGERTLLTQRLAESVNEYLPVNLRLPGAVEWVLRYSPKTHGVSISTLFRNCSDCSKTVLFVKDSGDHIFGGFASDSWEPRGRFYGSGEAFVFSFGTFHRDPNPANHLKIYSWTSKNKQFQFCDPEFIAMGGGEGRHALLIQDDLLQGCSFPTLTFGNPTLAASEEFVVRDLEIWGLEEVI